MAKKEVEANKEIKEKKQITCGIIMPLSEIDGCNEEHWGNVLSIVEEALKGTNDYEINVRVVSRSDEAKLIHQNIIQNIYSDEIIVCDVSCKNANVMFELGMRLAFNKPVVIIKDEKTNYSFDTGNLEHLPYPRDLRYNKIQDFKSELREKVIATYENEWVYLEHFQKVKISAATIGEREVGVEEYIINRIDQLDKKMENGFNEVAATVDTHNSYRRNAPIKINKLSNNLVIEKEFVLLNKALEGFGESDIKNLEEFLINNLDKENLHPYSLGLTLDNSKLRAGIAIEEFRFKDAALNISQSFNKFMELNY